MIQVSQFLSFARRRTAILRLPSQSQASATLRDGLVKRGIAGLTIRSTLTSLGLAATPALANVTPAADQTAAVHAQVTTVAQEVGSFTSPYSAENSLTPSQTKATSDVTLYLGVRPWHGGEVWVNPEIDQGFGLSDTLGVAGFPSAEAYKVGKMSPYFKLQRAFVRQTIALGGDPQTLEAGINQLRNNTRANRLVVTAGKMGVGDIFDTNRFAHDPRADFLNWSLVDTGSFDYAANAWGYSYGFAAEWYQGQWTLRAGLYNLSKVPNGIALESNFSQNALIVEGERRWSIGSLQGALRVTGFRNRGMFASFNDALTIALATGQAPDLAPARRKQDRLGIAVNGEQDITKNLGLFVRAGSSDGAIETYDFTDIDHSFAFGGALKGGGWGRTQDILAFAVVDNSISAAHQRWLAAGGLGVLVGDGALPNPGSEQIVEAYYAFRPVEWAAITLDFQHIFNPGYNRDRGPVTVLGARFHAGF